MPRTRKGLEAGLEQGVNERGDRGALGEDEQAAEDEHHDDDR